MKKLRKYSILFISAAFLITSGLTGQNMMKKSHSSIKKNELFTFIAVNEIAFNDLSW